MWEDDIKMHIIISYFLTCFRGTVPLELMVVLLLLNVTIWIEFKAWDRVNGGLLGYVQGGKCVH